MSQWHLESVKDGPRNLPVKFGQNRVSNNWDIDDIEFAMVGGGGMPSHFLVNPNFWLCYVKLWLSLGFDNNLGLN